MRELACPSCGARLQLPDDDAESAFQCSACEATFRLRGESEAITAHPGNRPVVTAITLGPPKYPALIPQDIKLARSGCGGCLLPSVLALLTLAAIIALVSPLGIPARNGVETASRLHMIEIGSAIRNYDHVHKTLSSPRLVAGQNGQAVELSWRVSILPFLEGKRLFDQFDQETAWNSPKNEPLLDAMPPVFERAGRKPEKPSETFFQMFTGPDTLWPDNGPRKLPGDFPDGTSNTFLFAEAAEAVPWSKPADMVIDREGPLPLPPDRFFVCMADGSVRTIIRAHNLGGVSDATLRLYMNPRTGKEKPPLD
jgi:hypothetical protein